MSDFELINKAAHRIYPTHLKEVDNSSFSWSGVLPTDAKSRLVKDSEGHKQTDDRNSHTLTHKLKGGASIEFNIVQNGKNHIAMAKYHKGGKLFTAIHSHEDPSKAIKTAYDSVARRIVTEEAEIALIEKMEKRIEKKTGKLSDKKEKIDVEPSEEKELKESRVVYHLKHHKDDKKYYLHVHEAGKEQGVIPLDTSDAHEARMKGLDHVLDARHKQGIDAQLKESTPPGMESWVKKNKARFVKEYGEKKGHEVLYATAWKLHNKMNEMEELKETTFQKGDRVVVNSGDGSPWTGRISRVGKGREGYAAPTTYAQLHSIKPDKEYQDRRGSKTVLVHPRNVELHEEELNELSKKTLASYVKKSNRSSFELGYDAASNEFHDDGDYKKTQKDEKKALKRQRFVNKAIDKLAEEELNELSKKTLASYIKQASHHARRNEYYAGRDHGKNQQESDKELEVSRKRQKGIEKAADKLAEAHTYTKEGLAKQIKYHKDRAAHHDSEAQVSFNKAQDLTGDKADLHFNAAKGHKAIADLHRKHIYDLKSFAGLTEAEGKVEMMYLSKGFISSKLAEKLARESKHLGTDKSTGEQHYLHPRHGRMALVPHKSGEFQFRLAEEIEQLDELSPSTLGRYIKFAAINKASHAAHGSISQMAMYNSENIGDKKGASEEAKRSSVHKKKEDKRTSGIITATDKLVRKAYGLHEASRPAPHPDKVVMTSSIRKDLGGGYMAKTRNGHFYKLDINALGEPGKGRELPKLGAVLDTSKHKFIGKDKVDLNLLKESSEDKNYLGPVVGKYLTHSGKVGMEIRKHPIGTYSYFGEWGAGGGHSKAEMDKTANMLLRVHPRHNVEKHYFGDVHNIKEDLNLLKEGFEIEPPEHVKAIGKEVHKTLHELGVHGKRVSYDYDSYKGPKHHRITVELGHYHPQEEKILDTLQSRHAPYKFHYGPNDVEIGTAAVIHPAPSNKMILKEHIGNETDSLKNYIHTHPILGRFSGKEEKYNHKEDGEVRAFHEPNGKHVLVYSKKTTPYGATHKATIYYKRAENEPMLPQTRKFVGHEPDHVLHAVAHEFTPIKEDLDLLKEAHFNKNDHEVHSFEKYKDLIKKHHPNAVSQYNASKIGMTEHHIGDNIVGYFDHTMGIGHVKRKQPLKEDLDHDHPDMKAYHAACKARDEAHLASIRYRMHHDIKQPEHRAKYDELEAEHHRLRDIEDAASEKVNGKLFAHHALKEEGPDFDEQEYINGIKERFPTTQAREFRAKEHDAYAESHRNAAKQGNTIHHTKESKWHEKMAKIIRGLQ